VLHRSIAEEGTSINIESEDGSFKTKGIVDDILKEKTYLPT